MSNKSRAPFSPIILERREKSLQLISPKQGTNSQNYLDGQIALQVRGKQCIFDCGVNCPFKESNCGSWLQSRGVQLLHSLQKGGLEFGGKHVISKLGSGWHQSWPILSSPPLLLCKSCALCISWREHSCHKSVSQGGFDVLVQGGGAESAQVNTYATLD